MKKLLSCCFILFAFIQTYAQQTAVSIIPEPVSVQMPKMAGNFTIDDKTIIVSIPALEKSAKYFKEYLEHLYDFKLEVKEKIEGTTNIVLSVNPLINKAAGAYQLQVTKNRIAITGSDDLGVFYGIQTLIQLLPPQKATALAIPFINVKDQPGFAYRGMHLDVCRHFMPVSFVKKYIDFLALHKFNNFHWHLTDDQGWRIEILKYPMLTQVGGCRAQTLVGKVRESSVYDGKPYCGFYTQDEIKEVVKYAADRYINIVPEIEMPGHALAAIAAYPNLSCTFEEAKKTGETWGVFTDVFCPTEYTFGFLQDVLDEVMNLFPSKYIHIGGDECPKDAWKKSAFCQQLIKEKNLKDEHGLQSYFIQRMEQYVNGKGRSIIGWDEILEGGLAPNATVMSWRGEEGGIAAAKQQHNVIMTPGAYCYFDHSQNEHEDSLTIGGYLPLDKVYNYDPVPKQLLPAERKYILGAQANVWSEYLPTPSKVEYMIFPRMSAMAEVLWTPKAKKDWKHFQSKMTMMTQRYDLWGTNYNKASQ